MSNAFRKIRQYIKKHYLYILIILPIFVLAIFFFWKEKLYLFAKINDQKVANFFSIIGSIITTLSIFLIYRQLQEVLNDRKAQSLPKLFPEEFKFKKYTIENIQDPKDSKIKSFIHPVVDPGLGFDDHNDALFSVTNVGNGTAVNISIVWLYEIGEIKDAIEDIYILPLSGNEGFDINYIKASETNHGFYGPVNYIQILGDKSRMKIADTIFGNLDLPELSVNIAFSDLHGNKYERNRFFARITKNGSDEFVIRFTPYHDS